MDSLPVELKLKFLYHCLDLDKETFFTGIQLNKTYYSTYKFNEKHFLTLLAEREIGILYPGVLAIATNTDWGSITSPDVPALKKTLHLHGIVAWVKRSCKAVLEELHNPNDESRRCLEGNGCEKCARGDLHHYVQEFGRVIDSLERSNCRHEYLVVGIRFIAPYNEDEWRYGRWCASLLNLILSKKLDKIRVDKRCRYSVALKGKIFDTLPEIKPENRRGNALYCGRILQHWFRTKIYQAISPSTLDCAKRLEEDRRWDIEPNNPFSQVAFLPLSAEGFVGAFGILKEFRDKKLTDEKVEELVKY